jgi:hypothetical protein
MIAAVTDRESRWAIEQFNDGAERKEIEALRVAITEDCVFESPAPPSGKQSLWPSRHSCRSSRPQGATQTKVGTVAALWRYPVKSMGGEMVASSVVDRRALHADRMWAVRDLEPNESRPPNT